MVHGLVEEVRGVPAGLKMVAFDMFCLYAFVGISYLVLLKSGVELASNAIKRRAK